MKIGAKFKERFLKIWRDPVWSKVISVGIIAIIALVWAKITNHSWAEIYQFVIAVLTFDLPLYLFLSVIALYFIVKKCIQLFRKRKDPFWDEQMGNYTFKELYNILLTQNWPVQNVGMQMTGRPAPTENLLRLFQIYYPFLCKECTISDHIDDGGYLYNVFAPKLVSFGLVDTFQKADENLPELSDIAYRASALGHKFNSSLEKVMFDQKMMEMKAKKKADKVSAK